MKCEVIGLSDWRGVEGKKWRFVNVVYKTKSVNGMSCATCLSKLDGLGIGDELNMGFNKDTHQPFIYIPKD